MGYILVVESNAELKWIPQEQLCGEVFSEFSKVLFVCGKSNERRKI